MGINPANGCAENCETYEGDSKFSYFTLSNLYCKILNL